LAAAIYTTFYFDKFGNTGASRRQISRKITLTPPPEKLIRSQYWSTVIVQPEARGCRIDIPPPHLAA
jgi:hypothetical protein